MLVFTSPKPTEGKLDAGHSIQLPRIKSNQKVGYVTPAKPNTNSGNVEWNNYEKKKLYLDGGSHENYTNREIRRMVHNMNNNEIEQDIRNDGMDTETASTANNTVEITEEKVSSVSCNTNENHEYIDVNEDSSDVEIIDPVCDKCGNIKNNCHEYLFGEILVHSIMLLFDNKMEKSDKPLHITEKDIKSIYYDKYLFLLKKECYVRFKKIDTKNNYKLPPCMIKGSYPYLVNVVMSQQTVFHMKQNIREYGVAEKYLSGNKKQKDNNNQNQG